MYAQFGSPWPCPGCLKSSLAPFPTLNNQHRLIAESLSGTPISLTLAESLANRLALCHLFLTMPSLS